MKDSAKIIRFPQKEKVREVAAHWIVQLDDGQLSKEKEQQFIKWLNASQLHKQEFFNLCYVWGKYDFFADLANVIPMDKSDNSNTNVCWNIHFRNVFVAGIIIGLAGLLVMMYSSTLEEGRRNEIAHTWSPVHMATDSANPVVLDDSQTLEYIIEELNQELNNKIVISDEEIKDLRLSRDYGIKNLQTFFQHLQNQYLISIYHSSDDHVYLSNEELRQL